MKSIPKSERIPDEAVQWVRDNVDCLDVARLCGLSVEHKGKNWVILCPMHDDTDPSCQIDADNPKLFYCFPCGKGGDAIALYRLVRRCGFHEAIEALSQIKPGCPIGDSRADRRKGRGNPRKAPAAPVAPAAPAAPAAPSAAPARKAPAAPDPDPDESDSEILPQDNVPTVKEYVRRGVDAYVKSAESGKGVYTYLSTDGGFVHEIRFTVEGKDGKPKTTSLIARPSNYGLVWGIQGGRQWQNYKGEYHKWKEGDPTNRTEIKIRASKARLWRIEDVRAKLPDAETVESPDDVPWILNTEGPSDAAAGWDCGIPSTTNLNGAKSLKPFQAEDLYRGKAVNIAVLQDKDDAGEDGAKKRALIFYEAMVAAGLEKVAKIKILPAFRRPDGREAKKTYDLRDWCEANRKGGVSYAALVRMLMKMINKAPEYAPTAAEREEYRMEAQKKKGKTNKGKSKKAVSSQDIPNLPRKEFAADALPDNAVILGPDLMRVAREALAMVMRSDRETIFQRGGKLVEIIRITTDQQKNLPVIRAIRAPKFLLILSDRVYFVTPKTETKDDEVKIVGWDIKCPPSWCAPSILADSEWREGSQNSTGTVPALEGIVEGPAFLKDGSILQAPGYDPDSGLMFEPSGEFDQVPENPTLDDAKAAKDLIFDEVLYDFPFQSPAHQSAWLSLLLSCIARHAFDGDAPLHLIDANIRGVGKSLLADVCTAIVNGRTAPRNSDIKDEDELRKQITGLADSGTPFMLLDNVSGKFGNATLDRALTSRGIWSDRRLGETEQLTLPLRMIFCATGNNVELAADQMRRTLHIRLMTLEEYPERRKNSTFKHPDIIGWLIEARRQILPAALTILRAWHCAGRPRPSTEAWGGFESWAGMIPQVIVWLGLADPAGTRETLDNDDGAKNTAGEMLAELLNLTEGEPFKAAEVLTMIENANGECDGLRTVFKEMFPRVKELPSAAALGRSFRNLKERNIGGLALVRIQASKKKGVLWKVKKLGDMEPTAAPSVADQSDPPF